MNPLRRPTAADVEAQALQPDDKIKITALTQLFALYPANTEIAQVLTKVATLNALYSTNILALVEVAKHIVGASLDSKLRVGSQDAVTCIQKVAIKGKARRTYSFATKYCSFHQPALYPIYDSFVAKALCAYNTQEPFTEFIMSDLENYEQFVRVLEAFRDHYALESCSPRQLDYFLWMQGRELRPGVAL